jgi:uncharacterized membrane protein
LRLGSFIAAVHPLVGKEKGMATFTVWKFNSSSGADNALTTLERLQKEELIQVIDGAVVSWADGAKKPKTRQLHSTAKAGAMGGAFWGFLFGLLFFVPLLGMAIGAGMGALTGSLADVGIDDDFIKRVRDQITPGTSALFLMSTGAVQDKVADEMRGQMGHAELIHTNLSNEQEAKLREAFSEEA